MDIFFCVAKNAFPDRKLAVLAYKKLKGLVGLVIAQKICYYGRVLVLQLK